MDCFISGDRRHNEYDMKQLLERNAIVIGGGMAGLMATRVLCNHFIHITVVERDVCPDGIGPRNGTSQSNQVYVLLLKDKQILVEEIQRHQNDLKKWI